MATEVSLRQQIHRCTFQITSLTLKSAIQFTNAFGVEWTAPSATPARSSTRPKIKQSIATFDEVILLKADLQLDTTSGTYFSRPSELTVRTISDDQDAKFRTIGLVELDLAIVVFNHTKLQIIQSPLQGKLRNIIISFQVVCKSKEIVRDSKASSQLSTKREDKIAMVKEENHANSKNLLSPQKHKLTKLQRSNKKNQLAPKQSKQPLRRIQLVQTVQVSRTMSDLVPKPHNTDIVKPVVSEATILKELQSENDRLVACLNQKQNELNLAKEDMAIILEKNAQLAKSISSPKESVLQLKQSLRMLALEKAEQGLKLEQIEQDLLKQRESNGQLKSKIDSMQGYLVVSVEKENELQKALLESQEQARELKTKLQATQERLEQVMSDFEEERKGLLNEAMLWQEEWKHKQLQLQKYSELLNASNEDFSQLKKNQDKLVEAYEDRIDKYVAKEEDLRANLEIIEEDTRKLYDLLQEKETEEEDLNEKLSTALDELEGFRQLQENYEALLCSFQNSHTKMSPNFPNRNNQNRDQSKEDKNYEEISLKERNEKLLKLLNESTMKIIDYEQQNRLQARSSRTYESAQMKLSELRKECQQYKSKISWLMKENRKLIEGNNRLGKDLNALTRENITLKDNSRWLQTNNKQLSDANEAKQFELEHTNKLLEQIKKTRVRNPMPVRKLSNDSDCTPLPSLVLTQKNISKVNVEISNEVEELPETNTIQLQAIYHQLQVLLEKRQQQYGQWKITAERCSEHKSVPRSMKSVANNLRPVQINLKKMKTNLLKKPNSEQKTLLLWINQCEAVVERIKNFQYE